MSNRKKTEQREMRQIDVDMTPMVDVTFLLLIFFMVTASFVLQHCLQQPGASDSSVANVTLDTPVEVLVDADDQYLLTTPDGSETEAASVREMRAQLRSAFNPVSYTHLTLPTICSV